MQNTLEIVKKYNISYFLMKIVRFKIDTSKKHWLCDVETIDSILYQIAFCEKGWQIVSVIKTNKNEEKIQRKK